MKYQILTGDNRETLKTLADNSIDAIVTDPPYGIDFLGKHWDANTGALETYQECLRVLKPGGHILAFSAARTYHHLAITLEQAGFEIRDQIMWIYSSGFPKSQDIGKSIQRSLGVKETKFGNPNRRIKKNDTPNTYEHGGLKEEITADVVCSDPEAKAWSGWGTQLKPAHEPICLARKPIKLSIARNCQVHGVGALNIDATRIPYEDDKDLNTYLNNIAGPMERSTIPEGTNIGMHEGKTGFRAQKGKVKRPIGGKGNTATFTNFSAEERTTKDRPVAGKRTASFHNATGGGETQSGGDGSGEWTHNEAGRFPSNVLGEIEGYQKYFYCPKVGRQERMEFNNHPTVKPIELMKYLIRLITPPGGVVLDPFNGSGSTGCAAVELGYEYIGCELDPAYVEIARKRIEAWFQHSNPTTFQALFSAE